MEKLQYQQVMRFTSQITEAGSKCNVRLTLDFKQHTTVGVLKRNAIAVFSTLQDLAGGDPSQVIVKIDTQTQNLPAWKAELGLNK
jgi:hypothetical protein